MNTDLCPISVDEQSPGFARCICGKYFEKPNKRGKPPAACSWYKEEQQKKADQDKADRATARRKAATTGGMTAVPKLIPADNVEEGDRVYYKSSLLSGVIQSLYAKEYLVQKVEGDSVTIIRNTKMGYKHHPSVIDKSKLYVKIGVDYHDLGSTQETEDEDDETT